MLLGGGYSPTLPLPEPTLGPIQQRDIEHTAVIEGYEFISGQGYTQIPERVQLQPS